MGDCEESKDDRTGANHCDNNLKSSRHDIFPIVLTKMSTLWRTVRKWFAENLKGRFKRCSSCQMQYSPQLGEKGSPCCGDGSRLAGPSRHPHCSKNGYSWPVDCLKFAWDMRVAVLTPGVEGLVAGATGFVSSWLTQMLRKGKTKGLSFHCVCVTQGFSWHPFRCCDLVKNHTGQRFSLQSSPFVFVWVSGASRAATALPGHNWCCQVSLCWVPTRSCYVVRALSTARSWDSCERAATQPKLSDPAIKSHQLRLLTQKRVTQFSDHFQSLSKSLLGQAAFPPLFCQCWHN